MNLSDNFSSPDEAGWYFFRKSKKSSLSVVFVNDDGIGSAMNEKGEAFDLDDLVGLWEPIEPENI